MSDGTPASGLPSTSAEKPPPRLGVVNGLRGVAILAVLWHHTTAMYVTPMGAHAMSIGGLLVSPLAPLSNGWLGVNLFFVLSGFVLALPYLLGRRDMASLADAKAFWWRRARRLLPLYYFSVLVSMFAVTRSDLLSRDFFRDVLQLFSFTYIFDTWTFMPRYNRALWSLAVEVWVSAAFPLLLVAALRFGAGRLLVAAAALALGVRGIDVATHTGLPGPLGVLKDGPLGRLDEFALGVWLCDRYVRQRLPRRSVALVGALVGLGTGFAAAVAWDNVMLFRIPYAVAAFLNVPVSLAIALVIVAGLVEAPGITSLLRWRPLQLAGAMSYSLYLWHLLGLVQVNQPGWDSSDVPVYLALTFALSAFTYRFIEFPRQSLRELFVDLPR